MISLLFFSLERRNNDNNKKKQRSLPASVFSIPSGTSLERESSDTNLNPNEKQKEHLLFYHHNHVLLCRSRASLNCTFLKLAGWIADAKLVRMRGEWAMSVSKSTWVEKKVIIAIVNYQYWLNENVLPVNI